MKTFHRRQGHRKFPLTQPAWKIYLALCLDKWGGKKPSNRRHGIKAIVELTEECDEKKMPEC